ncbi:MAG: ABC transporter permease [Myxococcaceae bacterium]|nr:ABC transporter permease [Myxococcaceae bacterium]MCI0673174.1 ABC transporter permease [Myxococcaceae bacterium]
MLRNLQELYQYRGLLLSLVQRELTARYRGSVLGFLWTFLNPTLLMLVYALVFSVYMRQDLRNPLYFQFVGLLPWIWFSTSVGGCATAISDRRDLLTKVRFPAQVLPASVVTTNLLNYLFSLPLMVVLGALHGMWPTWHILLLPAVAATQLLLTLGLGYVVAALNVTFRDLQHIIGNLLTLGFFVTPVLYPIATVPERFRDLVLYGNPVAALITSYQSILYEHRLPEARPLLWVAGLSVVLLWGAARLFESRREEFAECI